MNPIEWAEVYAQYFQKKPDKPSPLALSFLSQESHREKRLCLGIPTTNNRENLLKITNQYPSIFSNELISCLETFKKKPQPIERMRKLSERAPKLTRGTKIYQGIELFADFFNESPVREFLMLLSFDAPLTALWRDHYFHWGISILRLGTKKHWDRYLEPTNNLEIIGCSFEGAQTIASYDHNKRGFWIKPFSKPQNESATHGVGYLKLFVSGEDCGFNHFIIPLEDNEKSDSLFIPYENLLDRFCEINSDGIYKKNGNFSNLFLDKKFIAAANEIRMNLISNLFYAYPPQTLSKTDFQRDAVNLLAKSYALKFAGGSLHPSIMETVSREINQKALQQCVNLYGAHPETAKISALLKRCRGELEEDAPFENDHVLLYRIFVKFTKKREKLRHFQYKNTRYILLRHCIETARRIENKLATYRTKLERFQMFCEQYQNEAIHLAKMYGQFLIISKFGACIKNLNPGDEKDTLRHLYYIYAWTQAQELTHCSIPHLDSHYQKLKPYIPFLTGKLGFNSCLLDSIIPPQALSFSYDDDKISTALRNIALKEIYKASL